ncbi:MAG: methyltransferase domain-containing protein [Selenomonadaceae bacterium]|nr:methyltransferase domain-containing protein [Selenomonadaceae bacterium]
MPDNLEELTAAVQALPYLYQPIFGYEIQGAKPIRNCEDRLADVKKIYDALSAELRRPLRVLDLGCAQGYFSLYAAKWGGVVTGLDFEAANIDLCRLLARENADLKVNFVCTRIEDFLPTVKAGEYDLVLCFNVLHWCSKFSGFEVVQAQLADLAQKIDIGLFELALKSEGIFQDCNLPENYRDFLTGFSFVRVLSYNYRHIRPDLAHVKRPLCFASTKYAWFENLGLLKIDDVLVSPRGARTICYFCGDKFVKITNITDEAQYGRAQREINFLNTFGGQKGLPRLYITINEQDESGMRIIHVRDMIAGKTLREKITNGENFDRWNVIRQTLEWMVLFEQQGYYQGDVGAHNLIYTDDGRIYPVDYETIGDSPALYLWLYSAKLQFLNFINFILEPGKSNEYTFPLPMYLLNLKKHVTPRQYERIAAIREDEKFFARLYEILFEPEKDAEAYTVAETEILAIERYVSYIGTKTQEHEEQIAEQQRRIEELEKIIRERLT